MRKIKFRAWDKRNNTMCEVIELIHNGKYVKVHNKKLGVDKRGLIDTIFAKDFELMQFTGLLDKNKKEIFEGDVVTWDEFTKNFPVIWNETEANFEIKKTNSTQKLNSNEAKNIKVIGNIYENPELIKKGGQN